MRDTKNEKKISPLRKAFGEYFDQVELVEADLLNEESLIAAIDGSTYVAHTASPFVLEEPKDENELIKPAVDGTLAVMKGCKNAGVKRVVITSSIAAIVYCEDIDVPDDEKFTEENWTDMNSEGGKKAYNKSKTMAEHAAWDFVKALPASERFELVTICPSWIVGPAICNAGF